MPPPAKPSEKPKDPPDLHGNAPDRAAVALLIVDVINDLDFPGNQKLLRQAEGLGRRIAQLKRRCRQAGIPAIYVNDNRGKWRSDFASVIRRCIAEGSPGRALVRQVLPDQDDYQVLKPKHSAFYATPLDLLLEHIGVQSLIVTGLSTNSCILLTASDAYVRGYGIYVPSDCVAGQDEQLHRATLGLMQKSFGAVIEKSSALNLKRRRKPARDQ